jgi:hypothetical protein
MNICTVIEYDTCDEKPHQIKKVYDNTFPDNEDRMIMEEHKLCGVYHNKTGPAINGYRTIEDFLKKQNKIVEYYVYGKILTNREDLAQSFEAPEFKSADYKHRQTKNGVIPNMINATINATPNIATVGEQIELVNKNTNERLCHICGKNERCILVKDCRHITTCPACIRQFTHCPTCARKIISYSTSIIEEHE